MQEMKPIKEGKVREIYDNGDSLIMVATDRISCFDVVKTGYADYMGLTISFGNATLSLHMKILYMFISGLIFLGLATAIFSRKRQQER